MKSLRADALRLIRPFLSRAATVDLRGAAVEDFAGFVCLMRTVLVEDDFDDLEDDREDFCAGRSKGSNKAMISETR
jgi:hypothetical protein